MSGILLLLIFIVRLILFFVTDNKDSTVYIVELLNWGSIAFMALSTVTSIPQFKKKKTTTQ